MKCNHRLPDNLHCPTFFSQLSASVAFPSSIKTPYIHTHILQKSVQVSVQEQTRQPHFLAMYTWIFTWTLTPLTLVFHCWPAGSRHIRGIAHFRQACLILQNFQEIFLLRTFFSVSLYIFNDQFSFPYFECESISVEIAVPQKTKHKHS